MGMEKVQGKIIEKHTDMLIPILPFEKEFFAKYNVESFFYGHPLLDSLTKVDSHKIATENQSFPYYL